MRGCVFFKVQEKARASSVMNVFYMYEMGNTPSVKTIDRQEVDLVIVPAKMQSTGFMTWRGSGSQCWLKIPAGATTYTPPTINATLSNFQINNGVMSGEFAWDGRNFTLTG